MLMKDSLGGKPILSVGNKTGWDDNQNNLHGGGGGGGGGGECIQSCFYRV